MAVPASGTLSQLAMAQEALYGTYGSGTITGPISLYDMVNGGNTNGSGNSYPTLNTNCTPNPVSSCGTYAAINSATNPAGDSITVYYRSDIYSSPSNFVNTIGAIAYSSSTGSTHYPVGNGYVFNYITCANEVNLDCNGQIIFTQGIC